MWERKAEGFRHRGFPCDWERGYPISTQRHGGGLRGEGGPPLQLGSSGAGARWGPHGWGEERMEQEEPNPGVCPRWPGKGEIWADLAECVFHPHLREKGGDTRQAGGIGEVEVVPDEDGATVKKRVGLQTGL